MLLNLRIVIGHLPDQWIAQSRYDDLSNITTIVIDDRRIPEGQTIETIIAHEVGHARAAYKHRERYAARDKAERDAAYNTAQDYIINEMLKPSRIRTDGHQIDADGIDWSPSKAHLRCNQ